ncbi:MAG: hypothetical protein QG638_939, partial [Pseudomonadota bacterium]|nr:hypothetical protein [Pseudomonadota bacterium]
SRHSGSYCGDGIQGRPQPQPPSYVRVLALCI